MRGLALLVGLILIGNAGALASNTPLTVDSTDPGYDLFAPKPTQAAPGATPTPAPPPAISVKSSAERAPNGNPLWSIPLMSLTATREHPLFAPSRQPPPVATLARPAEVPAAAPPKPPEPEKPQLSLLGTVAGPGERIGLFLDSASKSVLRLKAGENHLGWTLRTVRPRQVELAKGLDNAVLDMPKPDMTPGNTPPTASVSPAQPVTAKATGVFPSPVTPAGMPQAQPTPNQSSENVNPLQAFAAKRAGGTPQVQPQTPNQPAGFVNVLQRPGSR